MPDFRFEGTTTAGRAVQGVIAADSLSEAKEKIRQLASRHKVNIDTIKKRKAFIYKVRKGKEAPVSGEQRAFSKEEVEHALTRLGYTVISIQPKLLDFTMKPPATEIVTFVRVSADLLREKLPYNEVLQLLMNDIGNTTMRNAVKEINNDLRQGKDSEEAFIKQERVLGRFTARMLGLASKSGNMADIYDSTAKFLERDAEFKRNLKSALITPLVTLLILFGACVFYIAYIFPETARLFQKLGSGLPPLTTATLAFSDFLIANMWWMTLALITMCALIAYWISTPKGRMIKDKYIIRIPVLGTLIHKTSIEIFCRVFNALYSGSGENIEAIRLAAEASGNKYMESQIKNVAIPMMLSQGKGLVESFEASGVFTRTAISRFNSGAETGTVKRSAEQIANYYEKETVYKLRNAIEVIQLIIALVIMLVITGLTVISSETAMISPKSPVG